MTANASVDNEDPTTWPDPPERGRCWFLGCPNEVPQPKGGGRPKVVCEQLVNGMRHTRLNKSLAKRGRITIPAPGSGQAEPHRSEITPSEKPVTTARQTYSQTLQQVQATLAGLPELVARLETAARTVADQEATAAEIAAVERNARAQIDQAEHERDVALAHARAAERAAADAQAAQAAAEEAAEEALTAEEQAQAERDEARAAQWAAEELAEQLSSELSKTVDERNEARAEIERLREQLRQTQHELSITSAQLEAAREQVETEKRHAAERVADQRERAERAEAALDTLRREQEKRPARPRASK